MMRIDYWTMHATDRLRLLWAKKMPASEIAFVLGTTKNAVIGKIHRLKLEQRRKGTPRCRRKKLSPEDRPPPKRRLPGQPKTKSELYEILAQAVRNTNALKERNLP